MTSNRATYNGNSRTAKMIGNVVMQDPRMNPESNPMPFDGMRLIYGGFAPIVTLEK